MIASRSALNFDDTGNRRFDAVDNYTIAYESKRLKSDVERMPLETQVSVVSQMTEIFTSIWKNYFADGNLGESLSSLWELAKPVLQKAVGQVSEGIQRMAGKVIKKLLERGIELLGQLLKLLLKVVVSLAAEVIKYLLFGLIGGPWSTLIPTILNILGPVLEVLDKVDDKAIDALRVVVKKAVSYAFQYGTPYVISGSEMASDAVVSVASSFGIGKDDED